VESLGKRWTIKCSAKSFFLADGFDQRENSAGAEEGGRDGILESRDGSPMGQNEGRLSGVDKKKQKREEGNKNRGEANIN